MDPLLKLVEFIGTYPLWAKLLAVGGVGITIFTFTLAKFGLVGPFDCPR